MNALSQNACNRSSPHNWTVALLPTSAAFLGISLLLSISTHAQWLTEAINLKSGWNAIYLHVDASYTNLDYLIGNDPFNPIQEIWLWSPSPNAAQFVTDPQVPTQQAYWLSWVRSTSPSATLTRLPGNVACLVRSVTDYTWNLKGKPVPPAYQWSGSGLNFFGFSTLPGTGAPSFDTLFSPAPDLRVGAEVFAYNGGAISNNPVRVFDLTTRKALRGESFWIRSANANRYFGPIEVSVASSGVRFGDSVGQVSLRIRNVTSTNIVVTLRGVTSELPPGGQAPIQNAVPVLVRGEIDITTLTYNHFLLSAGPRQWTLKPSGELGSEVEVVLGVDRGQMSGAPGDLYASVLRFTESLNLTQIDVPVTAEVNSTKGLWVGGAAITSVNHYLNKYAMATNETELTQVLTRLGLAEGLGDYHFEIDPNTHRILVFGGNDKRTGSYLLDGPPRVDAGTVARPFPLRLIVHNDGSTVRLLQRVYQGVGLMTNPVVTTRESLLLASHLGSARRISAVHLPFTPINNPWIFTGGMKTGSNLTTMVNLAHNEHASNPFLHTYHPDHDNLDPSFNGERPPGQESYEVRRLITLNFTAPANDFESLTRGGSMLIGTYSEQLTFMGKPGPARSYTVRGTFTLNQLTDIPILTHE